MCTLQMLDAVRLSPPRTLGAIAVLHPWRSFGPVGARRLKVAMWHHAGPASETTAARSVETAAARGMHPTSTTVLIALRNGQATACNERYP